MDLGRYVPAFRFYVLQEIGETVIGGFLPLDQYLLAGFFAHRFPASGPRPLGFFGSRNLLN